MKKTKNRLLMLLFLLVMNNMVLLAQVNRTVTGTVKDNKGLPVTSATVNVKGSSQSTTTDENGNFSITLEKTNALLVISSVGFNTKELNSKNLTKLDVSLISSASDMNEVVVTALGVKRDKKSIGFAVQQVKIDAISIAAPVDIAQGLQGKVAGLNISTSNGLANASSRIVIRGNNSLFGNNQPLIVVDGAVLDNKSLPQSNTENSLGGYTDWGNYLSYMNMDNVDNVPVLKGPNAAALYGARGANGVVLITSKKGVAKKGVGLEYNMSYTSTNAFRYLDVQNEYGGGFSSALWTANPTLPKTASGENYVPTLYPAGWQSNGGNALAVGGTGVESSHNSIPGGRNTWDQFSWYGAGSSWGPKLDGTMTRWWDGKLRPYSPQPDNRAYMFQTGNSQQHNLSFSSASDFGSIRLSGSFADADQPVPNVSNKNTNFNLGSNVKISKMLTAEISASYNQNKRLNSPEIGTNNSWSKFMIYGMSREYQPIEKDMYKNADGSKNEFPGAYAHNEYIRDMFWNIYERNQNLNRDEFLSTVKLNAEISPWLNAFVRTSVDLVSSQFETKRTTTNPDRVSGGRFEKSVSKDKVFNTDIMVTAHKEDVLLKGLNAGHFN
jgi:iron complex outermembrane receptor protein